MEKDHGRHVVGGRIKVGELQVGAGSCGIASSVACSGIKASPGKALSNAGRIHRYHLLHLPRESHYPGLLITLPVVLGGGGGKGGGGRRRGEQGRCSPTVGGVYIGHGVDHRQRSMMDVAVYTYYLALREGRGVKGTHTGWRRRARLCSTTGAAQGRRKLPPAQRRRHNPPAPARRRGPARMEGDRFVQRRRHPGPQTRGRHLHVLHPLPVALCCAL